MRTLDKQEGGGFYEDLKFASELLGQGDEGIETLKYTLKIGKLNEEVIPYLEEAMVIEVTGWTPEEIDAVGAKRMNAYQIIWSAKGGAVTRKQKQELRNYG